MPQADGSIIIDTRINNKGAEADLKALQAKAKSTAQQISALDKQLGQATSKRSKLADDLAAARQQAEGTAKELRHIDNELQAAKAQIAAFDGAQLQEQFKNARVELQKIQGEMISNANALEEKSDIYYKRIARKHPNVPIHAINQAADFSARSKNPELAAKESALSQQYALQSAKVDQLSNSVRALNAVRAQASGLVGKKSALESSITQQSDTVARLTGEYQRQEQTVAGLNQQRAGLAQQLDRETAAVNRQSSAMAALNMAADAARKFGTAIRSAFSGAVSLGKKALKTLGGIGARIDAATKGMRTFGRRMAEIASGALFFNLISSALSNMTRYVGSALTASGALRTALGNLAGAAQTAAAPLIQVLTPALAALANAAATVFSYIARLVAFLTGTTVSAAQQAAEGVAGIGDAAAGTADKVKKATRSLAGFDEITRLDAPQDDTGSGGGGGSSAITPSFDFTGKSPFLDSLLAAIEAGQWFQVGLLIGEKLRDSLNAIPWPDIQAKAVQWATNIADTINVAVTTPGLWEAIGHTLAQGLNTVTGFVDTFFQGVWWTDIGAGLARGLTQLVAEVDWPQLGRVLTDGMRAALLVLHGFVTTYTGWADLGMSIAAMIGAALSNIDWVQAAGDLSALAIGILTAINTGLAQIDWGAVGQTVLEILSAIDWAGLFGQLGQLFANLWPVILTTVVLPAILSWIGGTLISAISVAITGTLASFFANTVIPAVVSGIGSALSAIVAAIGGWPVVLIAAIVVLFAALIAVIVDNWDAICDWFSGAWDSFVAAWDEFWSLVATNAQNWWNDVTTGWSNFWSSISEKFNALKSALGSAWNSFWSGLASGVTSIWNGIVNTVKGAVNALIGFINGMLSGIVNGLNGAIDVLNRLSIDVPDWVPVVGGNHLGFNVAHITAPQIPYLAQGAVIPPNREFMAVLGDQSHGTNVEAPLATIQEAVASVMQDYQDGNLAALEQVIAVLRQILEAVYGIHIGDAVIGQAVARYNSRQAIITGRA